MVLIKIKELKIGSTYKNNTHTHGVTIVQRGNDYDEFVLSLI